MENLGKRTVMTDVSITNRNQDMVERMSGIEYNVEGMVKKCQM